MQGCGNKGENAPDGSTITINPSTLNLTNLYLYGDAIQDYQVIVKYSDGTPVPYADVLIAGTYAYPVVSSEVDSAPSYAFYEYPGANGNPSNVLENNGFVGETDANGVYQFSIEIFSMVSLTSGGPLTPNVFTDTILVSSGTAQASTTLASTVTTQ